MKNDYTSSKRLIFIKLMSLLFLTVATIESFSQIYTQAFPTTTIPTGWVNSNSCSSTSTNAGWKFTTSGTGYGVAGTTDHTPGGGTYFAWVDGSSPYPCDVTMTSADIAATIGNQLELSFWVRSNNTNDAGNNTLKVDFYDGATWHNNVYVFTGNNPNWFQATVGLSGYPVTGTGNVKLRYTVSKVATASSFYNDIIIDDISLIILLPCSGTPAPGVASASATSACASTGVNLTLSGVTNATGLVRQWQSSPNGINYTNISGALSTAYSAAITAPTYYRVKSTCNGVDSSFSNAVFVDLEPFYNCYCTAGPTSNTYGYIGQFDFANISYTSPVGCQSYTNNTSMVATTFYGNSYNLSAYINSCTGTTAYNTGFKVWIDFNQNGSYSDPGEEVISQNLTYFQVHGGIITIPSTATQGITGMRVMVVESGTLTAMNPCYSYTWGEVEDYSINILPPPDNDAGVSEFISPSVPYCGGDSVVRVKLENLGSDTLFNAIISLIINGGTPITTNWSGVIPPSSTDTGLVVVGTNPGGSFMQGDNIVVYTSMPNGVIDSLPINDTLEIIGVMPGLTGTYSIPGDFATINGAIDTLNVFGTCDTVIFEIAPGSFTASVEIQEFLRNDPTAPVIIRSATLDSADVIWTGDGTNPPFVLNGADYIWLEHVTLINNAANSNVVYLSNSANYNKVHACHLVNAISGSTSTLYATIYDGSGLDEMNLYSENQIENGSVGMYVYGSSTTALQKGNIVTGNKIQGYYYMGIYAYYNDSLTIEGNTIIDNTSYGSPYGIYCIYGSNYLNISGNHVYTETPGSYMGIYLSSCLADENNRGKIQNNIVTIEGSATAGIYLTSVSYKDVDHNTLTHLNSSSNYNIYFNSATGINFRNNLLTALSTTPGGAGLAFNFNTGIFQDIDYNNYYSDGSSLLNFGTNFSDLASYQASTGLEPNSTSINPFFNDTIAGITCNYDLDALGTPIGVSSDFAGNSRSLSTPDLGAREYLSTQSIQLSDDTLCTSQLELSLNSPTSVNWIVNGNTFTTNSVILDAGASATNFNVSVSAQTSCATGAVTSSALIRLIPDATLDSNYHICGDETVELTSTGSPVAQYSWYPSNNNTKAIEVSEPGIHIVTKNEEGCVSSASTIVTKSEGISFDDVEECNSSLPYIVDASIPTGTSYAWNSGSNLDSAYNELSSTGTYTVTINDSYGCEMIESFDLTVIDIPTAIINSDSNSLNTYFFNSDQSLNAGSNASYIWNFGDGTNSFDQNPIHTFAWSTSSQTFNVSLTISNECGSSETTTVSVISDPTGINPIATETLKLYPNPSSGILNIVNSGYVIESVQVFNALGQLLYSNDNLNGNTTLDLSELPNGSYMMELKTVDKQFNSRLIINK